MAAAVPGGGEAGYGGWRVFLALCSVLHRCVAACLRRMDASPDVRVRTGCVGVRRRNRGLRSRAGSETRLWFDTGHVPRQIQAMSSATYCVRCVAYVCA